ncbi:cell surface protein (Mas1) [Metarhizium album ARSEF 1941]|uniref:Cell surface protein (Mas1) n=1 Tax=Metarhizium album (strain ARSEF 1941) TaxID=1081103 RepID=A0A0B2X7Y8_METAS|nr:cell surface protein (Mas1) [Metarhizium album ARSEF 1941]KHO01868.1 cell surface protein (Mas1) [Metarhizium album ARSEF 1941]
MRSSALLAAVAASTVSGHGFISMIHGDNGCTMPGYTVTDGTPRDCVVNACGAQADTGIIRDNEIDSGERNPLGWTQGSGDVDLCTNINNYMGMGGAPPTNRGAASSVGVEDAIPNLTGLSGLALPKQRRGAYKRQISNPLSGLGGSFYNLPIIGVAGMGGQRNTYPRETMNADSRGKGATCGLPTPDAKGVVHLVYRQVNQDGAGPLTCAIDYTSAGQDPKAFQAAQVLNNVPGSGVSGLSIATNTDFQVAVQSDPTKRCTGKRCGVEGLCVVRCRNEAIAGSFGGGAVYTNRA